MGWGQRETRPASVLPYLEAVVVASNVSGHIDSHAYQCPGAVEEMPLRVALGDSNAKQRQFDTNKLVVTALAGGHFCRLRRECLPSYAGPRREVPAARPEGFSNRMVWYHDVVDLLGPKNETYAGRGGAACDRKKSRARCAPLTTFARDCLDPHDSRVDPPTRLCLHPRQCGCKRRLKAGVPNNGGLFGRASHGGSATIRRVRAFSAIPRIF